mmetsp:Transcript_66602/g.210881  ORF Transcript_66602/g.210881 Transcript_66602/m.210881 type:complete len:352 (-) Transcript_66602:468-1523(-)
MQHRLQQPRGQVAGARSERERRRLHPHHEQPRADFGRGRGLHLVRHGPQARHLLAHGLEDPVQLCIRRHGVELRVLGSRGRGVLPSPELGEELVDVDGQEVLVLLEVGDELPGGLRGVLDDAADEPLGVHHGLVLEPHVDQRLPLGAAAAAAVSAAAGGGIGKGVHRSDRVVHGREHAHLQLAQRRGELELVRADDDIDCEGRLLAPERVPAVHVQVLGLRHVVRFEEQRNCLDTAFDERPHLVGHRKSPLGGGGRAERARGPRDPVAVEARSDLLAVGHLVLPEGVRVGGQLLLEGGTFHVEEQPPLKLLPGIPELLQPAVEDAQVRLEGHGGLHHAPVPRHRGVALRGA